MVFQYASLSLEVLFVSGYSFYNFITPSSQKNNIHKASNMNRCYHSVILLYTRVEGCVSTGHCLISACL